jgi:hypothetical protein
VSRAKEKGRAPREVRRRFGFAQFISLAFPALSVSSCSRSNATPVDADAALQGDSGGPCWHDVGVSGATPQDRAQHEPALSVEGDHVHVLWMDGSAVSDGSVPLGTGELRYARSDDGGLTFQQLPAPRGATDGSRVVDPTLAVDSRGRLYASWLELSSTTRKVNQYVAFSDDHGATFSTPVALQPPTDAVTDRGWLAAGVNDAMYLVSTGGATGHDRVDLRVSLDHGATWRTQTLFTAEANHRVNAPSLATLPSGEVAAAWEDFSTGMAPNTIRELVVVSTDGATFSAPRSVEPLANLSAWGSTTHPRVAVVLGGDVLVAYVDVHQQALVARSSGSSPFAASVLKGVQAAAFPEIAVGADGTVHVAWMAGGPGGWAAYHAASHDQGVSFGDPEVISAATFSYSFSTAPDDLLNFVMGDFNSLLVTPTRIHYAWSDRRSGAFAVRLGWRDVTGGP